MQMQAYAHKQSMCLGRSAVLRTDSVLEGPGGLAVRLENSRALLLHTRCKDLCPAVVFSFATATHAAPPVKQGSPLVEK